MLEDLNLFVSPLDYLGTGRTFPLGQLEELLGLGQGESDALRFLDKGDALHNIGFIESIVVVIPAWLRKKPPRFPSSEESSKKPLSVLLPAGW